MSRRTIDEATARRLSVEANCDPRTLRKTLRGETAKSMASQRARRVLIAAGLLDDDTKSAA